MKKINSEKLLKLFEDAILFSRLDKWQRLKRKPWGTIFRGVFTRFLSWVHFRGLIRLEDYMSRLRSQTFWGDSLKPLDGSIFQWGFTNNSSEIELTRFFLKNLKPGEVVFDIGAHFGFYTILFALLVGENGKVFGFEPTPEIFRYLSKNTRSYQNIKNFNQAVWTSSGKTEFADFGLALSAYNTFKVEVTSVLRTDLGSKRKIIQVETVSLDDFCLKQNVQPDFIQIDAERAELGILKGSLKLLNYKHPSLAIEFFGGNYWTEDQDEILKLLADLNYSAFYPQNGNLIPYNGSKDFELLNLVFKHDV